MKTLRKFEHINATSLDEAVAVLGRLGEQAMILAGGTDVVGTLRFEVLQNYPQTLINLKTIPGLDYIREEEGMLKIGALTRLEEIAINPLTKARYGALAEAAHRTASPHIRVMGTIAGNLCQLIRCWYFRKEDNRFDCIRKGGAMCHAVAGDNRYHSIFGAARVAAPPCTANCPAGNEIPSYLESVRGGDLSEAAGILINTNPLAAITGRVCPHNCEKDCNRGELDETLSIRAIERYVGDYMLAEAAQLYQAPSHETGQRVAVVGAGPAGLTAAYYLRQLGHKVTIYEALEEAGGVLTYGIPPYRLAKDVVRQQVQAIERTGVEIKLKVRVGQDIQLPDLEKQYDALFLATGAWKQTSLNIADEELLTSGLEFLSRMNRGLDKIEAKRVLVIGGGSVAVDVATSALRMGAEQVTMACLESREEMPALADEIEQALKEGIQLMPGWGPRQILKENGKAVGMELKRCTAVYNAEHRFAPLYDENVREKVAADLIILAIGQRAVLSYAEASVKVNRGLIGVDAASQVSSNPKIYAGGDATLAGPLSVVAAIGAGRRAAVAINRYLDGPSELPSLKKVEHLTRCPEDFHQKLARPATPQRPLEQFKLRTEDVLSLAPQMVKNESDRCLNCGCDGVNPSDLAAALVALEATILTTRRAIRADDFWTADRGLNPTVLENDEIISEIRIPQPRPGMKSAFIKFAIRKAIDFPIVNCAAAIESENGVVKAARVCLNAVYCNPYRALKAEEAMIGKAITEENADAAGAAAVADAVALPYNKFKIQIARTMAKRAILGCRE
jgi:NADPH-dependent glutamate synthase beta subunit-like oxidoreductase/CO/xanthine dehydrogenase FAD-binding subunit